MYKTKQKDKILEIIKNKHSEFTIKDIYNDIKDEVGLTTIYRLVEKLVDNGSLNKSINKDNVTHYQYLNKCDKENHFYLKCEKCGDLIHIDCDCIEQLRMHITNNHKFTLKKEHIIIEGLCKNCMKGQ